MLKIWKIVAAGAGLWAVLRLFYGWKWGQGARAASIICHTCTRHSFTCCTHSKHGSEPADKRARRFLETQDLGRENSRPARRAYVALPGAAFMPHYCRLLGCMNFRLSSYVLATARPACSGLTPKVKRRSPPLLMNVAMSSWRRRVISVKGMDHYGTYAHGPNVATMNIVFDKRSNQIIQTQPSYFLSITLRHAKTRDLCREGSNLLLAKLPIKIYDRSDARFFELNLLRVRI